MLSATGPLVQGWFAAAYPGRSPYRLYALSNIGSLLALVSYPVLFEPAFATGTQARLFGLARKGAVEAGRDADLVLFDPTARRTIRQAELHHTSDYTPYEGLDVAGAVRTVLVRGRAVIREGRDVSERGWGRFIEREGLAG